MFMVIKEPALEAWCKANGHADKKFDATAPGALYAEIKKSSDLVQKIQNDKALIQAIYDEVCKLADDNKFNSLEKPKQMKLMVEPFSVDNDLLTPTFKLKRNVAKIKFEAEIKQLYSEPILKKGATVS